MSGRFSKEDVAAHNKGDDLWIIVDDDVYDVTKFQEEHPGGKKILARMGGKDASKQFAKYHGPNVLKKYGPRLQVGSLNTKPQPAPAAKPAPPPPATPAPTPASATSSESAGHGEREPVEPLEEFGDLVPFADPAWYQGYRSPYYNESHVALRAEVRQWVEERIEPNVYDWDEAKSVPNEVYKELGTRGYLSGLTGAAVDPSLLPYRVASVPPGKWDFFHEFILTDEISRCASGGVVWNLLGGFGIGLPPVVMFGSDELKKRVLPGILAGDKRICLAITEPDAGSDVGAIGCEAKLTEDGKHFIVNGEKKWITNGIYSDYFTTAVRTGGKGMDGISVLLIERGPGVTTKKMETQGMSTSGSTFITFEDVKVPVENLLGKKDKGFKVIMFNFNHERMGIIIQCVRFARVCYEESVKFAYKRKTFGKRLIDHPVIRMKLAHMARQIEATHNWLENLIFQAQNMELDDAALRLGGAIAGCKAQATTTFEFCAREASQIFGGLSYTKGGRGGKIERLYRDVRAYSIPGGSEEIMLDLSMRQSLKVHEIFGMKL